MEPRNPSDAPEHRETPTSFPLTSPQTYGEIVERQSITTALMEIQTSIGMLRATTERLAGDARDHAVKLEALASWPHAVTRLSDSLDRHEAKLVKHGEKLDGIDSKVSFVKGAMWVLAGIAGLIGLLAGIREALKIIG